MERQSKYFNTHHVVDCVVGHASRIDGLNLMKGNNMWRLWTRGWGPKSWWYWFRTEGFPLWLVQKLPRRVTLWAFIMVYANGVDSPSDEYKRAYDAWVLKHGITE